MSRKQLDVAGGGTTWSEAEVSRQGGQRVGCQQTSGQFLGHRARC